MDLGKALLVTFLVYALNEGVKQQLPKVWAAARLGVVLVVGEAVTFAVAASDWGHENIIMGKPLDTLGIESLAIAGLIVAALSVGLDKTITAVSSIGQNPLTKAQQAALELSATNLAAAQHPGATTTATNSPAGPTFDHELPAP